MSGRIDFEMGFQSRNGARRVDGDADEISVYILGNFSGNGSTASGSLREIDMDRFDAVLAQVQPRVALGNDLELSFSSIDDFHPDHWLNKIPLLNDLLEIQRQLNQPASAAQAVARIQALFPGMLNLPEIAAQASAETENQDEMLQRLLGKPAEQASPASASASFDAYLKGLLAPHICQPVQPQHQQLAQVVREVLTQLTGAVLHDANFQALEALWRATERLLQDAEPHRVFLLDLDEAALNAEAGASQGDLAARLLQHRQKFDRNGSVLLLIDNLLGYSNESVLRYLCQVAETCGAILLAGVAHEVVDDLLASQAAPARQWLQAVQQGRCQLIYPRYLQRLPYGARRDAIQKFAYEECSLPPQAHELLWSSGAFLMARAMLRGESGQVLFDDTPTFSYQYDGEAVLQAATDRILNEAHVHTLQQQGILPIISYRQRPGVLLLE
jgi:type VI secretion system protein ImpC